MDQDQFRRMLETPRAGGSNTLGAAASSRAKLAVPAKQKPGEAQSQPAFKPRKVKKPIDSKYRDRAAERRVGEGNDYAHVEAVLEDFEKRNAGEDKNTVDAQRKYLGGDGEHSVLVKGLDFALLEQNKAQGTLTKDDVDELEQAFIESSSHAAATVPKKRTRQDLIEELKRQRTEQGEKGSSVPQNAERRSLEQTGKFKPIGFKPIGSSSSSTKKKKRVTAEGGEGEKKKKKRKTEEGPTAATPSSSMPPPPVPQKTVEPLKEPDPVKEDYDIFADAGEYEGIDVGDDSDDEGSSKSVKTTRQETEEPLDNVPGRWIPTDEPIPTPQPESKTTSLPSQPVRRADSDEDMEGGHVVRLIPLESSSLPSIKDLLAMDKASALHDKNKKRKDKKKKKAGAGDDDDD